MENRPHGGRGQASLSVSPSSTPPPAVGLRQGQGLFINEQIVAHLYQICTQTSNNQNSPPSSLWDRRQDILGIERVPAEWVSDCFPHPFSLILLHQPQILLSSSCRLFGLVLFQYPPFTSLKSRANACLSGLLGGLRATSPGFQEEVQPASATPSRAPLPV